MSSYAILMQFFSICKKRVLFGFSLHNFMHVEHMSKNKCFEQFFNTHTIALCASEILNKFVFSDVFK